MSANQLVIGVDGGGTKTVAWVAAADADSNEILGRGVAGPANPCAVGFRKGMQSLEAAMQAALADAGRLQDEVVTACIALAGVGFESEGQRVVKAVKRRRLAKHAILTDDAEPILACAAPDGWGVALIAGTGSFVLARSPQGETARVGGWGYRFGDEGSGYAIAVAGLRAAAHAADGRGPPTILLDRFLDHFAASQPRQLIEKVYGQAADARAIAAAAPLVLSAAEVDQVASQIVGRAAEDLALMVFAAHERLGLPRKTPTGLAGGAILGSTLLREQLLACLALEEVRPAPVTLVPEPVLGAVLLARRAPR